MSAKGALGKAAAEAVKQLLVSVASSAGTNLGNRLIKAPPTAPVPTTPTPVKP